MINWQAKIGTIPAEWEAINAKNYLLLESGQRPAEFVTDNPNDIPSLGGENITLDGFIDLSNLRYIDRSYFLRMKKGIIKQSDILINKDGANTGKIALVNGLPFENAAVNEHLFIIRTDGIFDQRYLFYFLFSDKGNRQIRAKITGSAQGGINTSVFKGVFIPKPPLPEQRKIASILTKVDDTIQAVKNTIEKAERLKKSLMQNLLTGKLKPDGTWRTDDEFYETKIGFIPKNWSFGKLGSITNKITDGEHVSPDFQKDGNFIFSAEDIYEDGIHFENAKFVKPDDCIRFRKRCDPDFGDILVVSRGASIGRTCSVNIKDFFCLMGSVILIKADENILLSSYISSYLKSYFAWKELRRISGTTAQQAIYLVHLQKLRIAYPNDKDEQKLIAEKINSVDKIIISKKQKIQKLQRLKKALMQNLLTGKVRVKV